MSRGLGAIQLVGTGVARGDAQTVDVAGMSTGDSKVPTPKEAHSTVLILLASCARLVGQCN